MSLEPKKPIEKLLETTAKARRGQFDADPKMPNPMRAQLHHEIERVAQGDDSRRSGNWFHILWSRLAFTTVSALILVSIGTLWWWHEHPSSNGRGAMKLAVQEPGREAPAPEKILEQGAAAGTAAAPAASAFSFADSNAAAAQPAAASKDTNALARFAETKIAPSTPSAADALSAGENNKTDQSLLAAKSSAQAGAIDRNRPAQSSQMTNFRQQFSKTAADQAFRSKPRRTANLLNDFQVEQTDHEIRFVDHDGSTYSGQLEPLAQNDTRSIYNQKSNDHTPSLRATPSFDQKAQPPGAEYYFRATGYNTSLKKPLEIEGNYIVPVTVGQKKVSKAKTESEARDEQSAARITGVAKIDGESPVQIDAVAVP